MSESRKQLLLQYVTAILLIFLLTWHLVIRVPAFRGVDTFMETLSVKLVYGEITSYGVLLLIFAYAVLLHGFNGLRTVLLEWTSGRYSRMITVIIIILFIIFAYLATYTVVGISQP